MTELSLHILDIVQNSISASAKRISIRIEESTKLDRYLIQIADNGKGMIPEILSKAEDPFFTSRTTRVGLGIALFKQMAEQTGGYLSIVSKSEKGTLLRARFTRNHIDRPPLGDISGTICLLMASNPGIIFRYTHIMDDNHYLFDSEEIEKIMDGMFLNIEIMKLVQEMIKTNLKDIGAIE